MSTYVSPVADHGPPPEVKTAEGPIPMLGWWYRGERVWLTPKLDIQRALKPGAMGALFPPRRDAMGRVLYALPNGGETYV